MPDAEKPIHFTRRQLLVMTGGALGAAALGALTPSGVAVANSGPAPIIRTGATRASSSTATIDLFADTWSALDGLGRRLPTAAEVGAPRDDRFVGMFYFLWLGQHPERTHGPWDITQILAAHPEARHDPSHPAWGPLYDFHYWGEPHFGYYVSDDEYVIRQHAQMLADAGVDVIILDATNGFTYPNVHQVLFDTFADIRAQGGTTPDIAFMCPWDPAKTTVAELYRDVYGPGLHSDLWFRWKGKPLILANPDLLPRVLLTDLSTTAAPLEAGHTLGQSFTAVEPITAVGIACPTWHGTASGMTLTLRRSGPTGPIVAQQSYSAVVDGSHPFLPFPVQPPGVYYMEQSSPVSTIGWWSNPQGTYAGGQAYADGVAVAGDRELYVDKGTVMLLTRGATGPSHLAPGHTLGQRLVVDQPISGVQVPTPTWGTTNSGMTLTVRSAGPTGAVVAQQTFSDVADNSHVALCFTTPQPAGTYYVEQSAPTGTIGWWSDVPGNSSANDGAYADGVAVAGARELYAIFASPTTSELLEFFTFREHHISYFEPPTRPDQWAWLEAHPQHLFPNSAGVDEEMAVSVAQNAVDGRGGAMSESGARGRSFHDDTFPTDTTQTAWGLNFQEQWDHALAADPEFVFVTGWNEWVAQRLDQWTVVNDAPIFVDNFDQEHSRDIEPMRGGHGDAYYYQLVANIRRFKGARPVPTPSAPASLPVNGSFAKWSAVLPEYRDHRGDVAHRNHTGWAGTGPYVNTNGRNDIISTKVARDDAAGTICFYAQTAAALTPMSDPAWMLLFIDTAGGTSGWEGFNFVINRSFGTAGRPRLETSAGGWSWTSVGEVDIAVAGNQLEIAVPRALLGLPASGAIPTLEFKWIDNLPGTSPSMADVLDAGDAAPSGRFRYVFDS